LAATEIIQDWDHVAISVVHGDGIEGAALRSRVPSEHGARPRTSAAYNPRPQLGRTALDSRD
jgi:hypothetical protein